MAMDSNSSAQSYHQETTCEQVQTLESMLISTKTHVEQEKKPRPGDDQALRCPRCESTNTKFCYYNNYSLSQPRYFCRSCKRYWTKGGTLRNVPVGGGCRKNHNKKSSSSSKRSSNQDHHHHQPITTRIPTTTPINIPNLSFDNYNSKLGLLDNHIHGFPISGNPNNDIPLISSDFDPLMMMRGSGFDNNIYGIWDYHRVNHGLLENGEMGLIGFQESGGTTTSTAVTTVKQETCSSNRESSENSRGLWGLQWQNVGEDGNMEDLSSWNGIVELLHTPLI